MDALEKHFLATRTARAVQAGLDISEPSQQAECLGCHRVTAVRRRRMNTAYVNEESNWVTCCDECFAETVEHFADLWATYYS